MRTTSFAGATKRTSTSPSAPSPTAAYCSPAHRHPHIGPPRDQGRLREERGVVFCKLFFDCVSREAGVRGLEWYEVAGGIFTYRSNKMKWKKFPNLIERPFRYEIYKHESGRN